MKLILFILSTILFISCSKDDEMSTSKGTKLISIEYLRDGEGEKLKENYFYDSDNKIIEIQSFYSRVRVVFEYSNGKLLQFTTYNIEDDSKRRRDSIQYNPNGEIVKLFSFTGSGGKHLSSTHEYEYDDSGMLVKESTYSVTMGKYISFERYYWSGENIIRIEEYNESEELLYEFFYSYDNKNNYRRNIPKEYLFHPVYQSKNNMIKSTAKDHYGNLDLICNPCEWSYKYNLDDFPINIVASRGLEMDLYYE